MEFPTLSTSRLRLDKLTNDDALALLSIFGDEKVVEYYDAEVYKSEEQALTLIDFFNGRFTASAGIRWAIRLKGTDTLIGTCGFHSVSASMKSAGIGYELAFEQWGKGYAMEALKQVITFAYSDASFFNGLYRIQADTMDGNLASEALLKKLGFKEEGIRRGAGFWKGGFHDLKCFGLLKSDLY